RDLNRDSVAANEGGVRNPPWLFGILSIPYGVFNGILVVLIPFLLRKHGISPDRIANVIAISSIPTFWYFLWSPVVDTGLLRRTWVMIAAALAGMCGAIAIAERSLTLPQLTILLLAGNIVALLLSSACGAILTTLNPAKRGRASGWYQAGSLGGGALGAGAAIWLADKVPLSMLAIAAGSMVFLPALAAFLIPE